MFTFGALLWSKWHNFPAEMWPLKLFFFFFFFVLKPFSQCCLMAIGLPSAPVMVFIWVMDRPLYWRTAHRVLRLSTGAVSDSTSCLFCSARVLWRYWTCLFGCVWPQQRWHAARSLAYLNNPTTFKHRKLLCLCHQEAWQPENDREWKYLARFWLLFLVSLPSLVFANSTWNFRSKSAKCKSIVFLLVLRFWSGVSPRCIHKAVYCLKR